ncbi:transcriptional regulator [Saccharomonospora sp. CUA-673]|uniref:helix-turn-helix domain-containing protein n=1 Tax=Saccharomonospora sp. CUA-673 TaxID=1904969 RepID=UPI00095B1487|nr:helix-turn-helix transcriptional regulator [Saccharomonospora sp. CUA-673]OLT39090.1 transcriptional regulator [Saccharomonospora sp. CUA-673]
MSGRIDLPRLTGALDDQRAARGLSWRQVADEADVSPSLLSRMRNGLRPDLDGFIALVQWLGTPAERFTTHPDEDPEPALETQLAMLLRARTDLAEADKEYLLEIVGATMRRISRNRTDGADGGSAGGADQDEG